MNGNGISLPICKSAPCLRQKIRVSTPPLSLLQSGCPSCHPTDSVKALKAQVTPMKCINIKIQNLESVGLLCCIMCAICLWQLHMSRNQLQVNVVESPSIHSDLPVKQLFTTRDSVSLCDNKPVCNLFALLTFLVNLPVHG